MMPSVEIRMATSSDGRAALAYFSDLMSEGLRTVYKAEALPSLEDEVKFLRSFETNPNSAWFAAVLNGSIVGNLGVLAEARPQTQHVGSLGMSVLAPYRSTGLGTRLIETAFSWAESTALRRIQLEVLENNPTAISLYERFGFSIEGRKPGQVLVDGKYLDLIQMGRVVT